MPVEDRKNQRKIQCWVPLSMWKSIEDLGYTSPTVAVTKAFEKLLTDPICDTTESQKIPELQNLLEEKERCIETLNADIRRLSSDPNRDAVVSQKIPELQTLLVEKDKHIVTLKDEIEGLNKDREDLKEMHRNYMLQMQTLINQKQIEAPGARRAWWKFW